MTAVVCHPVSSLTRQPNIASTVAFLFLIGAPEVLGQVPDQRWIDRPQGEWPQITMVNQIDYVGKKFPIAGCSFLLDTGVVPSRFVRCRTRKA